MLIKPKIDQVKLGGTSWNVEYCLTFGTQAEFVRVGMDTGQYPTLEKGERVANLKAVYKLAKQFEQKKSE